MLYYYDSENINSSAALGRKLGELININMPEKHQLVVLCIGSDRSTGDSLGPILGYKLKKICYEIFVYGDIEHPVHAANLSNYIDKIHETFENPYIIAVDASLGREEHIGFITLGEGPLKPGLGVKKELPEVGDLHITGIVNTSGNKCHSMLQTTRLSTIVKIADVILNAFNYMLYFNGDSCMQQQPDLLYQQRLTS